MATEADLLQAGVFLSALQQQLIEVRNLAAIAGENIKLLTAVATPLVLAAAPAADDARRLPTCPLAVDAAVVARRSDLLAGREQATAAGKMVGVARGAMLPHVNLSLQRDYYSHEDLFGSDATSWTLGVYATWDFRRRQRGRDQEGQGPEPGRRLHGRLPDPAGVGPGHRGLAARQRRPREGRPWPRTP